MLDKELKSILKKYGERVFVYEWDYFSMRIHDELTISVLEEYQFLYVEINFIIVEKELNDKNNRLKFWDSFFKQLKHKRYNDLCGFLDNDRGIALIFGHSGVANNNDAWLRFCEGIFSDSGYDMRKWSGISYSEYPPKEFFVKN